MKITVNKSVSREIDVPKYFETKIGYYMLTGDGLNFVRVSKPVTYIAVTEIQFLDHHLMDGFTPISEAEFKNAFLRVSLAIEETLNN